MFRNLISRAQPLALSAALLLLVQPCFAQICDFSSFPTGTKLTPGEKFPSSSNGPFVFKAHAPTGAAASGTVIANPVDGSKMLQLVTTGNNGQPYAWVGQAEPVQTAGKTLEWAVDFSVPEIGTGSGVYIALVGGESVGGGAWALNQFQPLRGTYNAPLSDKPSLVLGLNIVFNMQAQIRRLEDEAGTTGVLSCYKGDAKKWAANGYGSVGKLNNTDTYRFSMKYDAGRGEFSFELQNLTTHRTMGADSFPASDLISTIDLKRLRLVAGDIMANSSFNTTLNIHSIELKD